MKAVILNVVEKCFNSDMHRKDFYVSFGRFHAANSSRGVCDTLFKTLIHPLHLQEPALRYISVMLGREGGGRTDEDDISELVPLNPKVIVL